MQEKERERDEEVQRIILGLTSDDEVDLRHVRTYLLIISNNQIRLDAVV